MERRFDAVHPSRAVRPVLLAVAFLAFSAMTLSPARARAELPDAPPVSFSRDVMAVLSKTGCNLGTCHGNARGKGGFQLSLRGQDPADDFRVLTREWLGRRTNVTEPDRSLLLLKATMQVAHVGGKRFETESDEYRVLRDWIAQGLPADSHDLPRLTGLTVAPTHVFREAPDWSFQLRATATFADGSTRDVTDRAVFDIGEPLVEVAHNGTGKGLAAGETVVVVRYLHEQRAVPITLIPQRPPTIAQGSPAAHRTNIVDRHVFAKLDRLRLAPAPLCDDVTFLRRASFDLIGCLPTASEAKAFLAETAPDKRTQLVRRLLDRPEFADWWALKWADMLRVEEKTLDAKGTAAFHGWLRTAFAERKPLDQLVRELIAARGSTYEQPPANFYRALRDPFARSEAVGQLFLGVRLQCAKCHNHPFDRWTQDDYYAWANVFARVDYKIVENKRKDKNDQHEFDGEQIVLIKPDGDVNDPRTGKPRPPQFLAQVPQDIPADHDRLIALADWLTHADNERFVQMLANRTWRQLMGRGLVEPVDDFRATNPPSHPEMLADLANELRASQFNLRRLLELIATSDTYQLAATTVGEDSELVRNYAAPAVRRLPAEAFADALAQACDEPLEFTGQPRGMKAVQLPGVGAMVRRYGKPSAGDTLLKLFGRPQRLQSCECERTEETTLTQAFWLVSGDLMHRMTTAPDNIVGNLTASDSSTSETIEELYWRTLSRPPSDRERQALVSYVDHHNSRNSALQDVLWCLVTSHEFLLRR